MGVLGVTAKDLTPRAIAVTPYVVANRATVTTTLALLTKAQMLRNRPAAALFAGGVHVGGDVSVTMHAEPQWFDANIRRPEAEKYPPAKSLLAIPFHRRLLWWYVGRVVMTFDDPDVTTRATGTTGTVAGDDRATITSIVDGHVRITPLDRQIDVEGDEIPLDADVSDGPGCLLVHHETEAMAELLSLTLRGTVRDSVLEVTHRKGSLTPQNPRTLAQLASLRQLGRAARANRPAIDGWNNTTPKEQLP